MSKKPHRLSLGGRIGSEYKAQLDRMVASAQEKLRDLSGSSKQVVRVTSLDESDFRRRAAKWPKFHDLTMAGIKEYPQFADLMVDIYFALYQYEPRLREANAIASTHRLNRKLLLQAMSLDLWEQARIRATLNQGQAMIGLVYIAQAVLDGLPDEIKHQAQAQEEAERERERRKELLEELLERARQAQQQARAQPELQEPGQANSSASGDPGQSPDAAGEGLDQPGELDQEPGDPEANDLIEQLLAELGQAGDEAEAADAAAGQQAQGMAQAAGDALRRAARKGLTEGVEQQAMIEQTLVSWGEDPGEWNALPIEERMALAERLQKLPNLRAFADEVGRMKQLMTEARQQPNAREAQELTDVTIGGRLAETVASERLLLAHPLLKTIFLAKLAQQQLLVNQYTGKEQAGKGPMILLVDVSGSTQGTPERWGKGFVMACLELCKKDERDAAVAFFDWNVREEGTFLFPRGKAPSGISTLAQKIQVAEFFTGGGTNFEGPLDFAIDAIESAEGEWAQADIVMVTDGVCQVRPEWAAAFRARCQAKAARVHGIMLDLGQHHLKSLEPFCDRAWAVSSFAGPGQAAPIFLNIVE